MPAVKTVTAGWSPAEQRARLDFIAAAYRIAALEGKDDGVFNHFSLEVPGEEGRSRSSLKKEACICLPGPEA